MVSIAKTRVGIKGISIPLIPVLFKNKGGDPMRKLTLITLMSLFAFAGMAPIHADTTLGPSQEINGVSSDMKGTSSDLNQTKDIPSSTVVAPSTMDSNK
jgi:hypothetical protein